MDHHDDGLVHSHGWAREQPRHRQVAEQHDSESTIAAAQVHAQLGAIGTGTEVDIGEQDVDVLGAQFGRELLSRAKRSHDGDVGQPRDEAGDEQFAVERLVFDHGDAEIGAHACSMDRRQHRLNRDGLITVLAR